MRVLPPCLLIVLLAGCSSWGFPGVYRIDVEQGNIVTREMVDQLKTGMSRRQVRYILGTPLIEDSFNQSRWDYVFTVRNGNTIKQENRVTVFFEGDTLNRFTSTIAPGETDDGEAGESAAEADTG